MYKDWALSKRSLAEHQQDSTCITPKVYSRAKFIDVSVDVAKKTDNRSLATIELLNTASAEPAL